MSDRARWLLRLAVSAGVLALVLGLVDVAEIVARLRRLEPQWIIAAVALSVLQVAVSAWRWQFTARRLGIALPLGRALGEYYLATFLNQVLPGGVTGDAARAWRHGRATANLGPAVRAVMIERASGQLVMLATALLAVWWFPDVLAQLSPLWVGLGFAVGVALVALLLLRRRPGMVTAFRADLWQALLAPRALPFQLLTSLLVVASYIGVFWLGARAIGAAGDPAVLLPLIPLVLLAMLIPLSISGWGFREGAAALLWPLAGLPASEGVAVSLVYGGLVLLASLPGALVLILWPDGAAR